MIRTAVAHSHAVATLPSQPIALRGVVRLSSVGFSTEANRTAVLCADAMRYHLLNAIQSCSMADRESYGESRLGLYQDIHTILQDNKNSGSKAQNLYVLLYSQFFTMRVMVKTLGRRKALPAIDDKRVKEECKALVKSCPEQLEDFQEQFLSKVIVECCQISDRGLADDFIAAMEFIYNPAAFDEHDIANVLQNSVLHKHSQHLETVSASTYNSWKYQQCMKAFIVGAHQIDMFIQNKLPADVVKYQSRVQRLLYTMNRYQFMHGWVTAAGLWVFGIGTAIVTSILK